MSEEDEDTCSPQGEPKLCCVCGETGSGVYFGAMVCLPCKSFYIRSTKDGSPRFTCMQTGRCDITKALRLRCQACRFQKCVDVGMARKEKPEVMEALEGQELCAVCGDIANGLHFGKFSCEGCKKFFRRGMKEHEDYECAKDSACAINPRTRNSCKYCRYQKSIRVGMSREAIKMGRPKKKSPRTSSPISSLISSPTHFISETHRSPKQGATLSNVVSSSSGDDVTDMKADPGRLECLADFGTELVMESTNSFPGSPDVDIKPFHLFEDEEAGKQQQHNQQSNMATMSTRNLFDLNLGGEQIVQSNLKEANQLQPIPATFSSLANMMQYSTAAAATTFPSQHETWSASSEANIRVTAPYTPSTMTNVPPVPYTPNTMTNVPPAPYTPNTMTPPHSLHMLAQVASDSNMSSTTPATVADLVAPATPSSITTHSKLHCAVTTCSASGGLWSYPKEAFNGSSSAGSSPTMTTVPLTPPVTHTLTRNTNPSLNGFSQNGASQNGASQNGASQNLASQNGASKNRCLLPEGFSLDVKHMSPSPSGVLEQGSRPGDASYARPQGAGPQGGGPQEGGPQEGGPQGGGPQGGGPQGGGPQGGGPQVGGPQGRGQQGGGPQGGGRPNPIAMFRMSCLQQEKCWGEILGEESFSPHKRSSDGQDEYCSPDKKACTEKDNKESPLHMDYIGIPQNCVFSPPHSLSQKSVPVNPVLVTTSTSSAATAADQVSLPPRKFPEYIHVSHGNSINHEYWESRSCIPESVNKLADAHATLFDIMEKLLHNLLDMTDEEKQANMEREKQAQSGACPAKMVYDCIRDRIMRNCVAFFQFFRSLPGHDKLCSHDVHRNCTFGSFAAMIFVSGVKRFDAEKGCYKNFWNYPIDSSSPVFNFREVLLHCGKQIHECNIDNVELVLLIAMMLISADLPNLKEAATVDKIHCIYWTALKAYVKAANKPAGRLHELLKLIVFARELTEWHNLIQEWMKLDFQTEKPISSVLRNSPVQLQELQQ